jgi:hypothetical protein
MVLFKTYLYIARIYRAFSSDKSIEAFINCVKCVLPLKLLSIKEPISREQLKLGIESVIPSILNVTRYDVSSTPSGVGQKKVE